MIRVLAGTGLAVLQRPMVSFAIGIHDGDTPVNFRVPRNSCDCHVHVFCDPRQFPFSHDRLYTPPSATVEDLRKVMHALQMHRVVIVSPAVYNNNDCTLDAIRRLGRLARGIALVSGQSDKAERNKLRRGGVRGIRLNFETLGVTDPQLALESFRVALKHAIEQGWHIQVNTRLSIVAALEQDFLSSPAPLVFDHFVQAQPSLGLDQPGFAALVRLLKEGGAYVKISGSYRISTMKPDYADVTPLARALIDANPKRILWGSDWPHPDAAQRPGRRATDVRPPLPVDDGRVLNQLAIWAPNPAIRQTILVENPARLYEF